MMAAIERRWLVQDVQDTQAKTGEADDEAGTPFDRPFRNASKPREMRGHGRRGGHERLGATAARTKFDATECRRRSTSRLARFPTLVRVAPLFSTMPPV